MPTLTKEKILGAKFSTDIFPMDEGAATTLYYSEIKKWHPDVCEDADATDVFIKLSMLHKIHSKFFMDHPGMPGHGEVQHTFKHELGNCMIQPDRIMLGLNPGAYELVKHGVRILSKMCEYPSEKFKKEMGKYFPDQLTLVSNMVFIRKNPRTYPIKLVIDYFKGKIPPVHVAWIMNSIYNTLCYVEVMKNSTFNGITPMNLFIDPAAHIVVFTMGWWHAATHPDPVKCLPRANYFTDKDLNIDMESARLLALEMLGDRSGVRLHSDPDIPKPMLHWLMGPPQDTIMDSFVGWSDAVHRSFGPRKFIEMKIDDSIIYSTKEK